MLDQIARVAAERFGDAPAFVAADGWALSYRDLDRLSDEAAVGLARLGLGPGDVLGLTMPSLPEYVVAYAAAAKLGAVTAGVNDRLAPAERASVLAVAGPRLVLATAEQAPARPPSGATVVEVVPGQGPEPVLSGPAAAGAAPPSPAARPRRRRP